MGEPDVGAHGVPDVDGDANAGRADVEVWCVEDLAALAHQLPFLGRVAPVPEGPGQRNDVPRDRPGPDLTRCDGAGDRAGAPQGLFLPGALRPLFGELSHPALSRACLLYTSPSPRD